ncbi:MAG TPA: hypothetical protein VEI02_00100, partial [Planctomycetota bacterium]|nr:hypothetical protein [Planctomycetota bacterium]
MFALMHKYRAPVLWTCVFLMVGFGAWALLADSFRPERPVKELGTFVLPTGEKASVTDAELAELQQMLQANRISVSFDERGQNPIARELGVQVESPRELLWAYLVLRDSARAGGFTMTDEAVRTAYNESFVKPTGAEEISEADWRKRAPSFREFFADLFAIKRFRGSLSPVEDATYAKLFEKFKTDYEELRAEFVFFDGTTIATPMDPRASAEDRVELDKWLRDDAQKGFRQQEQIPEEGEFEVLYVNFRDLSNLEFDAKFELKWQPEIARAAITV